MQRNTYITKQEHLEIYCNELMANGVPEFGLHIEIKQGQRTLKQNSAIHVYFKQLAEALNDAGLDMKKTLREEVEIPWSAQSVKEYLWKPIQKIVMGEASTTKMDRSNVSEIYEILTRLLLEKFGVDVPFPQNRYPS